MIDYLTYTTQASITVCVGMELLYSLLFHLLLALRDSNSRVVLFISLTRRFTLSMSKRNRRPKPKPNPDCVFPESLTIWQSVSPSLLSSSSVVSMLLIQLFLCCHFSSFSSLTTPRRNLGHWEIDLLTAANISFFPLVSPVWFISWRKWYQWRLQWVNPIPVCYSSC